ncbi:hypothetical protein DM826_09890 [Halonotius aquaticus]|uniref:Uncharacterized protein n=1 Tax=Halonotius aquaticus TaxID=2216978 RepID=A0A3A6PNG1_9EURY|nr:hypothetical protein [Halonotius aquaticus]RJX41962.1 hypothetical protein DM826_09890 [Halonotius aquaticus]
MSHSTAVWPSVRSPIGAAVATAVVATVVLLTAIATYLRLTDAVITTGRSLSYPVIWIVTSLTAAVWIGLTVRGRPYRWRGVAIGGGYTLVIAWLTGLLGATTGGFPLRVHAAPPGWGPIILYDSGLLRLSIVPFKLIAYLALGYVIYALVAAHRGSVRAAALGVVSCVSCTGPLLVVVIGAIGGTQATTAVATAGYDIATVALVATFGLLVAVVARQQPTG